MEELGNMSGAVELNTTNVTCYNMSMVDRCPDIDIPAVYLVTQVLYALVCIVGLLGNTLVIYVVLRFSKMQTVTNMYIVNLAIADECFLIGIPFLITTMNLQYWTFGNAMCKAYMISTSINQFTSSIFLFIMSADRYLAVCHPISSNRMRTPFISRVVSVCAWSTSVVFMLPVFMYASTVESGVQQVSCVIKWPMSEGHGGPTTFTLYSLALGFAVPLVLIMVFYCLVIRKLQTVGPKNKSKEKKRSHRKVTKLVLTVITVYVLCWLPYWITQVALIYSDPSVCASRITITVYLLAGCLSYSNSAMNPVLYAFLSENFKKSFLKACTCAKGKDINATLHMENSVFPRKNKGQSERTKTLSRIQQENNQGQEDENHDGNKLLVSRVEHSMSPCNTTSRSNATESSEMKEFSDTRECHSRNGSDRVIVNNGPVQPPSFPTEL